MDFMKDEDLDGYLVLILFKSEKWIQLTSLYLLLVTLDSGVKITKKMLCSDIEINLYGSSF